MDRADAQIVNPGVREIDSAGPSRGEHCVAPFDYTNGQFCGGLTCESRHEQSMALAPADYELVENPPDKRLRLSGPRTGENLQDPIVGSYLDDPSLRAAWCEGLSPGSEQDLVHE